MSLPAEQRPDSTARGRLHTVVFEADTPAGRAFDIGLMLAIGLSVLTVMLESVPAYQREYGRPLRVAEWCFTGIFTVEYVLRLLAVRRPLAYARSFFGMVDLLAILPTYLSVLLPGAQALLVVRVLRLLRVFRVLKLASFLGQAEVLRRALTASREKITVFLATVVSLIVVTGAVMYLVETGNPGFDSIPRSMYWAVVTLTTVGFGDITPKTFVGQMLASALMIVGYGIIAVPTGIVSVELARASHAAAAVSTQSCPSCAADAHQPDARFCRKCGHAL